MSTGLYCGQSGQARGSETVCRMEPSPAQRAARDRIAAELAAGRLRPARHPHRPRLRLRQAELPLPRRPAPAARPVRRMDPQDRRQDHHPPAHPRELAEYQPLFDNAKKLRALLAELQDLTLEIIEADSSPGAVKPAEPETSLQEMWAEPA